MANKAQQELEALLDMGETGQTDAAHAHTLAQSAPTFDRMPDDADFAFPEALVTAVGAGWLLGPVGGALMGVAQGILGKQARQNAIDDYARDMEILEAADDIFTTEVNRLAESATNPRDIDQLSGLLAQMDMGIALSQSASPELQQRGAALIEDAEKRRNDFAIAQETQAIAADVEAKRLQRELNDGQVSWYTGAIGRYNADSAIYDSIMRDSHAALNALKDGSPANLVAATNLITRTLDPAGVVRPEDQEALAALGSLWERANSILERARSGKGLLPEMRQDLADMLYGLRATATEFQTAIDTRYIDEYFDMELLLGPMPGRLINNFQRTQNTPAAPSVNIELPPLPAQDYAEVIKEGGNRITSPNVINPVSRLFGGIRSFWSDATEKHRQGKARLTREDR